MTRIGPNEQPENRPIPLRFVNTVRGRASDQAVDLLPAFSDLVVWCRDTGALPQHDAEQLLVMGEADPLAAASVHSRALHLRDGLYRTFSALADGLQPAPSDLVEINSELARAAPNLCCLRWDADGPTLAWSNCLALDRPLWQLVHDAVELLVSDRRSLVKRCEASSCSWLFLDDTRNHSRRWCDMATCGNREKARRFRQRRRERAAAQARGDERA